MTSWQSVVDETFEQLVTMKSGGDVNDEDIARAIFVLLDGCTLASSFDAAPCDREVLLRVVYLLFVVAPCLEQRSLALLPVQLELVASGEGTLEELLDHARAVLLSEEASLLDEIGVVLSFSGQQLAETVDAALSSVRRLDLEEEVNVIVRQLVAELMIAMPFFREQLGPQVVLELSCSAAMLGAADEMDLEEDDDDLLAAAMASASLDDDDLEDGDFGSEDEDDDDDLEAGVHSLELSEDAILVLLPPGTRCADIRRAAAEVRLWWKDLHAATPGHDVRVEWSTFDERTAVTTAYDSGLDVVYMVVRGEDPAPIAERMSALLGGELAEELLERLRVTRDRETWMAGLSRVALIAELRPDAPVGEALQLALEHPEAEVRHAALLFAPPDAIDGLEEAVQGLALTDPMRRVRTAAARCLGQTGFMPRPPNYLGVAARFTTASPILRRAVMRFAWEAGLWLDEVQPAGKDRALTLTWLTPDGASVLHYLEDEIRQAQRFVIRGDEEGELTRWLTEAFALIPTDAAQGDPVASSTSALKLALPGSLTHHDVSRHLAHLGWAWSGAERDDADEYASITWTSPEGCAATLRLGLSPALWLEGPDPGAAALQIRSVLPARDCRQILEHLALDLESGARQQALLELSAVAPLCADAEILHALLTDTRHPTPEVRWDALRAVGGTGWVEVVPHLEEAATLDPDPSVRQLAGDLAGMFSG
ncbi:hypothetical protein [Chondromyces crocatus]|uniref:Uncharacterized protein n=1 Tax=Chondromyces crocatus TaxID=52 RepID=A0A0K1ERF2_CHOCO|nr:hypothetical protein [Chondromyces crocatus]AKT43227.1 uncharacterized protein CMC5_074580 [Chondromyces crocatus]